jgi:cytochrome b subunit of formate dehydrogenase
MFESYKEKIINMECYDFANDWRIYFVVLTLNLIIVSGVFIYNKFFSKQYSTETRNVCYLLALISVVPYLNGFITIIAFPFGIIAFGSYVLNLK